MITEAQRKRRMTGIYSSDVARVMAGGDAEVYLEKVGEREPPDISDLDYVQLGNLLESAGLDAYERSLNGAGLGPFVRSPDTLIHPVHTWLGAHLDAQHSDGRPVEVKAVGGYNRRQWGEPGTDQVSDRALWQTQAQMAVTGAQSAVVPVVFATEENLTRFIVSGRVEIATYFVDRSKKLIDAIIDRCGDLWGCVEARIPPSPRRPTDAAILYTYDKGTLLEADAGLVEDYMELREARAEVEDAEKRIEVIEGRIQAAMQTHAELRHNGETLITWRRNKDSQILDGEAVKKADPGLWARCLKLRKGSRVFRVLAPHARPEQKRITVEEVQL